MAGTPSLRTLRAGATQAAAGNDPRLGLIGVNAGSLTGPLPGSFSYGVQKAGSSLLITWSATAQGTSAQSGFSAVLLWNDNQNIDQVVMLMTNPLAHMTLPTRETVVTGLSSGTHTILFTTQNSTTDANDVVYVTIVEVQPNH